MVFSSAASAIGSVFGMNLLLGNLFNQNELIEFAMKGEALASAAEHADNIAPALFGGFTLVKNTNPVHVLQIPTPSELFAVIVHPQIEIKTAEARSVLPQHINLKDATLQWANLGSLVHALHTSDYELIGQSLKDVSQSLTAVKPYQIMTRLKKPPKKQVHLAHQFQDLGYQYLVCVKEKLLQSVSIMNK